MGNRDSSIGKRVELICFKAPRQNLKMLLLASDREMAETELICYKVSHMNILTNYRKDETSILGITIANNKIVLLSLKFIPQGVLKSLDNVVNW